MKESSKEKDVTVHQKVEATPKREESVEPNLQGNQIDVPPKAVSTKGTPKPTIEESEKVAELELSPKEEPANLDLDVEIKTEPDTQKAEVNAIVEVEIGDMKWGQLK